MKRAKEYLCNIPFQLIEDGAFACCPMFLANSVVGFESGVIVVHNGHRGFSMIFASRRSGRVLICNSTVCEFGDGNKKQEMIRRTILNALASSPWPLSVPSLWFPEHMKMLQTMDLKIGKRILCLLEKKTCFAP